MTLVTMCYAGAQRRFIADPWMTREQVVEWAERKAAERWIMVCYENCVPGGFARTRIFPANSPVQIQIDYDVHANPNANDWMRNITKNGVEVPAS